VVISMIRRIHHNVDRASLVTAILVGCFFYLTMAAVALLMISPCAERTSVFAADNDEVAPPPNSDQGESDAEEKKKRSYLEKYAKASARLEAGVSRLHARGRFRRFNAKDQQPMAWTAVEYFVEDDKLRINMDHGPSKNDTDAQPPYALLLTPDVAAQVVDPGTDLAWPKYLAETPKRSFEAEVKITAWRFLRASYCCTGSSVTTQLANGGWTLESVEADPENNGWLLVRCKYVNQHKDDPRRNSQGTVDIWMDESQDFVIRKARSASNLADMSIDAGPYVRVGDGGWLPKALSCVWYLPSTDHSAPGREQRRFLERWEFELLDDVETSDIPDSYFTLESLGIASPSHRRWWTLLASAAVLIAAFLAAWRWRARSQRAPHSGDEPGRTEAL